MIEGDMGNVFKIPQGALVRKKSGSQWQGRIVGYYSTQLTPVGYCVESDAHAGSVQIYPEAALEQIKDDVSKYALTQRLSGPAGTPLMNERGPSAGSAL